MKQFNVAILGATGAVGREMLKILEEYDFPVGELRPLASARSAGSTVPFKGQEILVQEAREDSFEGMDFVLGAVGGGMAKQFAPPYRQGRCRLCGQQLFLPSGSRSASDHSRGQRR